MTILQVLVKNSFLKTKSIMHLEINKRLSRQSTHILFNPTELKIPFYNIAQYRCKQKVWIFPLFFHHTIRSYLTFYYVGLSVGYTTTVCVVDYYLTQQWRQLSIISYGPPQPQGVIFQPTAGSRNYWNSFFFQNKISMSYMQLSSSVLIGE